MLFFLDYLLISQESVSLQCVFHSIRFKVNKGWSKALLLFLCPYASLKNQPQHFKTYFLYFYKKYNKTKRIDYHTQLHILRLSINICLFIFARNDTFVIILT